MRLTVVFSLLVMFFSFTANAAAQKANFSGTWTLNADKSITGSGRGGMRSGSSKMIVKLKKNKMTVETFRKNRDGKESSSIKKYTLDGKKCKNKSRRGKSVSTVNWKDDGTSLTIFTETFMSFGNREFTMESEAVWTLEEGFLKIKSVRTTPRGEMESTLVYELKK